MTPTRFRRRPETVEAVRYDGTEESVEAIYEWLGDELKSTFVSAGKRPYIEYRARPTLRLDVGDWLARDGEGRLHVLDAFDMIEDYEPVEGAEDE